MGFASLDGVCVGAVRLYAAEKGVNMDNEISSFQFD